MGAGGAGVGATSGAGARTGAAIKRAAGSTAPFSRALISASLIMSEPVTPGFLARAVVVMDVSGAVTVEDEYFPPPPELRETLRALGLFLDVVFSTAKTDPQNEQADREFTAAQVLATL